MQDTILRGAAGAAPPADRAEALERIRGLTPRIAARAEMTEHDRCVPRDTIRELTVAGLFGLARPRMFGGADLGLAAMVEVATEIGAACGSTGWVYGVLTGHDTMVSLFPEAAQREVFADPGALTASVFRLSATVAREPGGDRLTDGRGRFCSGVDHARWVIVGADAPTEDGGLEPSFFLIPITEAEIVDDWFTAGMRGTGSRSILVADAFIPEHRRVSVADLQSGGSPGARFHGSPAYRTPLATVQPFSLIGAPLGMAYAAVKLFSEGLRRRVGGAGAGDQGAVLARIAAAAADIDAAYATVIANCERIDAAPAIGTGAAVFNAKVLRDTAYAAQKCRYAVTSLFESSGGSGIYDTSSMQRVWRDVNSACAHAAFSWDTTATAFGRALMESVEP